MWLVWYSSWCCCSSSAAHACAGLHALTRSCILRYLAAETRAKTLDKYRNIGIMAHIDAGKVREGTARGGPLVAVGLSLHLAADTVTATHLQ